MTDVLYLAVGEREPAPGLPEEAARLWGTLWNEHPLCHMAFYPAFACGRAAEQLDRLYGLPRTTMKVNLMAPHPSPRWDGRAAARTAWTLATALRGYRDHIRLFLLGRRVARAFQAGSLSFGVVCWPQGLEALVLPHPSPRNRWFNEERNRSDLLEWVEEFTRR